LRRPIRLRPRAPIGALAAVAALALPAALAAQPAAAQPTAARPTAAPAPQASAPRPALDSVRLAALKRDAARLVDSMATLSQQMVDQVFSYGELGYQETETSKYLTGVLRKHGFQVTEGASGMPTAWVARWGSGKPVIALGSDIDGIPQASQKPGVAYRDPVVDGAPGHGEGHNAGVPLNVTAAIAVKRLMEREKLPGTIVLWPGTAEELVGAKAYFVRDGMFKDVDAVLFSHVGDNLGVSWGSQASNGLVSLEFKFRGSAAHAAGAPWRGRSALDAVELMNVGWNYRREHLRTQQRSHHVVRDGGDQPNVVPTTASVWYYLRETTYPGIMNLWSVADSIARGAALMTGTTYEGVRVLGAAWPQHFSKPIAEAMHRNIQQVGLPRWDAADHQLARGIQREVGATPRGLDTALAKIGEHVREEDKRGGGSDDIGDVSWVVPTVTLRFPSNIPDLPGHHWANAVAMATPIAHKGVTAGAKAQAMTLLDLLTTPQLVTDAWTYFRDVQTKDQKYIPLVRPQDRPATELNAPIMARYREQMRKFYYDPAKHRTYLEQLGVKYPMVREGPTPAATSPSSPPPSGGPSGGGRAVGRHAVTVVQFARFGPPAEVLDVVEAPDPGEPGPGEALVDLVAAPINPSDLYTVHGTYGIKPPLPAVPGYEGIGRVAAVGAGVEHLAEGDRVLLTSASGTWRSRLMLRAAPLFALPPGDDLQLAMLGVNPPTAFLMLEAFVALEPGDWVVQNAANSGVGAALVAVARARGLRTVNLVRRERAAEQVRTLGGDVVVVEGPELRERVHAAVREAGGDPARLRLGVDAVAGRSAGRLMRCLAPDATLVNYGALSGEPMQVDGRDLIFLESTVRGFWLARWFQRAPRAEQARVMGEVAQLVASGALHMPVEATYPLGEVRQACAHAARPERDGKVLLVGDR
jgi:aminobenzoyl-glutamate utilization protein B